MTTVTDRLVRLRYVRRSANPDDRRRVVAALTPLLYRARELYGVAREAAAALARHDVDELALLRDFVRSDRELNERRARLLARR